MILPPEHELMELFEVEPVLADPGAPWAYNGVTFTTLRGEDEIRFELYPGDRQSALTWTRKGHRVVQLCAGLVERLRIQMERSKEAWIGALSTASRLDDLVLQLKPFVSVLWGYEFV